MLGIYRVAGYTGGGLSSSPQLLRVSSVREWMTSNIRIYHRVAYFSNVNHYTTPHPTTPQTFTDVLYDVRFEVFTAVTMKNTSSGMLPCTALARSDVSEQYVASIFRDEEWHEWRRRGTCIG
jgi:hypothetical protein